MSVNVDLLRRTLAHIEQHPEEWEQEAWRCGTSACFAGHAAILAGGQWAAPESDVYGDALVPEPADDYVRSVGSFFTSVLPTGTRIASVESRARRVLGINGAAADALFHANNTLDDLRRIVGELCDGAQ